MTQTGHHALKGSCVKLCSSRSCLVGGSRAGSVFGCLISGVITVQDAQQLVVNAVNVMNEECNTDNGSIDIDVTGGTGSYGYSWSNGSTAQDISGLTSGTYTVDVIDGNGCAATASFTLTNDVSNCSAFCFIEMIMTAISYH